MAAFIRLMIRRKALVAALLLASLVAAAYGARTVRLRFQFSDFYTYPGSPALPLYERDIREFGDPAGYVIAMVEAEDVFDPHTLTYIERLTTALTHEPVFSRIRSLTNTSAVRAHGDEVVSGLLVPRADLSDSERAEIKRHALSSPLLLRRLISPDAKATAVLAEMKVPATLATIEEQSEAIASMNRALLAHAAPPGVSVRVTGAPSVEVESTRAMLMDQMRLVPAVLLLLIVMLYVTFRNTQAVILAMAAVSTSVVWTAGIFSLFGRPADLLASIIPVALLVYGVVDPIFVLARVLQKTDAGRPKEDAVVEAFSELALPCFLTSVSTALGFAAFLSSDVPMMRVFGVTVAVGVLLAWVTTNTVLPVLLAYLPVPQRRLGSSVLSRAVDRGLVSTWSLLKGRSGLGLGIALLLLVGGGLFARHQTISNEYIGSLPHGPTQDDVHRLESKLTGVIRLNVYLEGQPGSMKDPAVLQAVERIDRAITERQPLVTLSASLADVVAEAHQAFSGGDAAQRHVPGSRTLVAQYLSMVDPADRSQLVTDDYARSHIAILLADRGSAVTREIIADVQSQVEGAGLGALGVRASLTGNTVVGYTQLDRLVVEVLESFVLAFAIIVTLQWLLFRSLRLSLISVVPNVLPVVACFCATRAFGIQLRLDTSLVLCVSIGGLFNTTIHYTARVLQRVREGERDPDQILLHAMRSIGPSSLYTAIVLSAGFAVFMLSSFSGLQALGLLSMVTLLSGFVSDMVVTTLIMRVGFGWKRAFGSHAIAPALAVSAINQSGYTGESS